MDGLDIIVIIGIEIDPLEGLKLQGERCLRRSVSGQRAFDLGLEGRGIGILPKLDVGGVIVLVPVVGVNTDLPIERKGRIMEKWRWESL
jgi:hypothetical protein